MNHNPRKITVRQTGNREIPVPVGHQSPNTKLGPIALRLAVAGAITVTAANLMHNGFEKITTQRNLVASQEVKEYVDTQIKLNEGVRVYKNPNTHEKVGVDKISNADLAYVVDENGLLIENPVVYVDAYMDTWYGFSQAEKRTSTNTDEYIESLRWVSTDVVGQRDQQGNQYATKVYYGGSKAAAFIDNRGFVAGDNASQPIAQVINRE